MADLDFPDEEEGTNEGIVSSLFGPRTAARRRPASATNLPARKPTVSFQEPSKPATSDVRRPAPSFDSSSPLSLSVPSRPAALSSTAPSSSRTLDDLFSTATKPPEERPRTASRRRENVEEERAPQKDHQREEIESLKKELSTLRYEREQDQQLINELRRTNENLREDHEKELSSLRKEFKAEISDMQEKYEGQLREVRSNIEDDIDVVKNVKRQEDQLVSVQSRLENLDYTLSSLKDTINAFGNYNEPVNRVVDLAEKQIEDGMALLRTEKAEFQAKKEKILETLEREIEKMTETYYKEIAEGRQWILNERVKLEAEREAFKEEQQEILSQIEERKMALDKLRTDFVSKEHDLLVRVVNERHQLDEERRMFERQRHADINRMRAEAEHLEKCFLEVQRSHQALQATQFEVELERRKVAELYEERLKKEVEGFERWR
ncbi:unnamed protein product [Bursaphelenchus xylophilus]|uniref:(pine wood nematode) hypothetical protein n=1 Tax=Bursaphelenchus xylophilus TaxID=6326 RepID=A0A7I8WFU5_BURXY|nr:unnamed protein product [Bursaphelenchus xylophilus]CAG9111790.1 unnamed protein product [Bursaphelenchus xylophilus]